MTLVRHHPANMVWFRVDDNLAFHPKVIEAGNAAMGLWVRAGAWSAANLTNGFIPTRIAFKLGSRNLCYRLVDAKLFEEKMNGFQFHGWDEKNFTKQQVEATREGNRKRQADLRKRHLAAVPDQDACNAVTPPVTNNVTEPDITPLVTPRLTAPHPYPSLPSSSYVGEQSPVGAPNDKTPPPPRFCLNHPDGTPKPCQACQAYRKRYETWLTDQTLETKRAIQAQARAERATRHAAIADCTLCDAEGYRPNRSICDHIDRTDIAASGIMKVRAALNRESEEPF